MSRIDPISEDEWMLLSVFIGELHAKSTSTLFHFQLLNQALEKEENFSTFALLQSILLHSAQVSLILFPTDKKFSMRGERLRQAVGLADELEFLSNRTIRNDIAHMDERLHKWYEESPYKNIVRRLIGDRNLIGGETITAGDIFEHYIPSEKVLIFRGNEYDMSKLCDCIGSVSAKTDAINKNHWVSDEFRQYFKN